METPGGQPVTSAIEMTRILVQDHEGHYASTKEELGDEPRPQEDHLMKYMLLQYANVSQTPHYTPEAAKAARQSWFDLLEEMKAARVYLENYGLAPETSATTVRVRAGETRVQPNTTKNRTQYTRCQGTKETPSKHFL